MAEQALLSKDITAEIDKWIAKYPADQKRSAVIPALHIVQRSNGGWLSEALMVAVADYLYLPKIAVFEVASFYSMFELSPVGKHKLSVCTNISCMLSGSDDVMTYLKERLNINVGETTTDGKFTLKSVECLGACVNAPVMQVGQCYHENLTPEKLDDIIKGLES